MIGNACSKNRLLSFFTRFTLAFSLACLLPSCGLDTTSGGDPFPYLTQTKMQTALDTLMSKYSIPGAVVGVWYPNTGTWIKLQGYANQDDQTLIQKKDIFRIGTITQTFTAVVVLQLVDEGVITLEDTLYSFTLSGIDVPNSKIITVRQLLNHTSGLFNYSDDTDFQAAVTADPSRSWSPAELVNIATNHSAYFPPGGGFHQSNTDYVLLGMIVQKKTLKTMSNQIRTRIVTKLSMTNTVLPSIPPSSGTYASGYIAAADGTLTDVTSIDPSVAWAAGGMNSILTDLKIWAKALGTGQLLTSDSFSKQTGFSSSGDFQYGLGIMYSWGFYGYYGEFEGYSSAMFYLPSVDGTIIVLLNKSGDPNAALELFQTLAKIVFPDQFPDDTTS